MLANRRFLAASLTLSALAAWLCFVPLFGLLGYEFSLALSVAGSFAAAVVSTRARTFAQALAQSEALLALVRSVKSDCKPSQGPGRLQAAFQRLLHSVRD